MITLKIIDMETGFIRGKVKGKDQQDCENLCLAKGVNIYDDYFLISEDEDFEPASPYIEDIINY